MKTAASGRWTLAAALCGAGIAVRETGVILAAFVLVQAWRERRWRAVQLGTLAVIAGWACSNHFRHAGLSNVHQMPELLYMAFKIPVNLLVEVFGLDYWTDSWTYVCHPTAFIVDIPVWLPLGKLHRVGVCVRGLAAPLTNVFILATTFGALPAILLAAKAKSRRLALPPVARLALYYGLLMFALGVCSGRGVQRLVDYGWPAFLIATALAARELDRLACWPVILLHLAMGVANLVMLDFFDGLAPPALLALGGLAAQASLYALLRTRDLKAAVRQNIPPATQ